MRVQLESTTKLVELNGVPARVWEGVTERGVRCCALVTRIAVSEGDDAGQFAEELQECRPPSPDVDAAIPARLIL